MNPATTMQRERLKLLASVGIGRRLTSAEENVRQERALLRELLKEEVVDMGKLRSSMFNGAIDSAGIRFLCWKLSLGVLPAWKDGWEFNRQQLAERYNLIHAASMHLRRGRCTAGSSGGSLKYTCQWDAVEATFRSEHFSVASMLVQDLRSYRMIWDDGATRVSSRQRARFHELHHTKHAMQGEAWAKSLSAIEDEFDLHAVAYVFSSALEVECVGGPGTFWCLARFTEGLLRAGAAHDLTHALGRLLAVHDPPLARHLRAARLEVGHFAAAWFRSLFAACLPLDALIRVYDRLLSQGLAFAAFVALAALTNLRARLLAQTDRGRLLDLLVVLPREACSPPLAEAAAALWARPPLVRCRVQAAPLPPNWSFRAQAQAAVATALRLFALSAAEEAREYRDAPPPLGPAGRPQRHWRLPDGALGATPAVVAATEGR